MLYFLLLLPIGITLVYLFYKRLIVLTLNVLHVAFVVAFLCSAVALFFPVPFEMIAGFLIERSQITDSLVAADSTISSLQNIPQSIGSGIAGWFQREGGQNVSAETSGYFVGTLLPQMVVAFTIFLRGLTFVLSLILMIGIVYVRYSLASYEDNYSLEQRVRRLEERSES